MEPAVELSMLLAYYGALLTERQREILLLRVDNDYSLFEIAEREGISRQAAHDTIRRAQAQLLDMEARLGFIARVHATEAGLLRLSTLAQALDEAQKPAFLTEIDALIGIWEDDYGV